MSEQRPNFEELLERLKARKLTDGDYAVLIAELNKVVSLGSQSQADASGRRVVAKLPFGMDIVK